ncbi:unnamed protein product [Victoria cruziana]
MTFLSLLRLEMLIGIKRTAMFGRVYATTVKECIVIKCHELSIFWSKFQFINVAYAFMQIQTRTSTLISRTFAHHMQLFWQSFWHIESEVAFSSCCKCVRNIVEYMGVSYVLIL